MKGYKWNFKKSASFIHIPKLALFFSFLFALGVCLPMNVDAQRRGGGGRSFGGDGGRSSMSAGSMSRGASGFSGMSRGGGITRMNSARSFSRNYGHHENFDRDYRGYRGIPFWRYSYYPYWGEYYWGIPSYDYWFLLNGYNYYDNGGVYYKYDDDKYQVVPAPIGHKVKDLPKGAQQFTLDGTPYFYFYGSFYVQHDGQYEVVDPPIGAQVESIPDGYDKVLIDGQTYYTLYGVQYKAVLVNNQVWYQVIKNNMPAPSNQSANEQTMPDNKMEKK